MAEKISAASAEAAPGGMPEELTFRPLSGLPAAIVATVAAAMIFVVLNQVMNWRYFADVTTLENTYLYILAAAFLPIAFLAYPAHPAWARAAVPWYDWLLAIMAAAICGWFAWNGRVNLDDGWEYMAPMHARYAGIVLWLIILEALRRTGGWTITIIVFLMSLYPVVAEMMPGRIQGKAQSFLDTMGYHMFSVESVFGIPMRVFGSLVFGFILFGIALSHTGGAKFFNDLAFALVGRFRGGAAQVGVVSSMLQGSISGSVISNVISSGVVSIPAMKRTGFSPQYAAGVEAVASTGAVLMPPVMGTTAFVMASFLQLPYSQIALAALIPGLLFYIGLVIQIDAYAAREGLKGLAPSELPSARVALKTGWPYLVVFAVLIYFMLQAKQEAYAPFYATATLLVINQFMPTRLTAAAFFRFLVAAGRGLAELVAILTAVGFVIGAFSVTGLAGTLANDLVFLAGDNKYVLLLMGALTSFIFGMGMTVTACYIFLAVVLAPALIKAGLDPLAVHLFIMYWGMVSFITPPVALATFAAASLARAQPFKVGLEAMRLGAIIYLVPFIFVLEPALILKGSPSTIIFTTATALAGVFLIASAMQGYVIGGGKASGVAGALARLLMLAGGMALAWPHLNSIGLDAVELAALGVGLGGAGIGLIRAARVADVGAVTARRGGG
ncbi:MAG: TRAP transporter fused permease subunit [Hyphomicrobiaceae bacterium]